MKSWYALYQSQCWYRNTFLVNNHTDVVEKNNIYNSGCHFTCTAMMLNTNAAMLASELSKQYYFSQDSTGLVWDNNRPNKIGESIYIPFLVTQHGIIEDIKLTLVSQVEKTDVSTSEQFIKEQHAQGLHIICGNAYHSLLVAGEKNGSYFIWDPDTSWRNDEIDLIKKNLSGEHTIEWLYKNYNCNRKVNFWVYSIDID